MPKKNPIQKLREEQDLSLRAFAEKVGVDFSTVWRWETGAQAPTLAKLRKVATAFDVPVSSLLG